MKKQEIENIHNGHRERLINTVDKCGLEGLSEVQVLEFILFYIFPRGDVNPLSHRLLKRYKTVSEVLEAKVEDLMMVEGMGERSAKKLHNLLNVFDIYVSQKASRTSKIATRGDIYDKVESVLRFKNQEMLYMIALSKRGEIIGDLIIGKGNNERIMIDQKDIALFVINKRASAVVVAHNHPNGSCSPSSQDIETDKELNKKLAFGGCELIDNLILGSDGIYSIKDKAIKRAFFTNELDYENMLVKINKNNNM